MPMFRIERPSGEKIVIRASDYVVENCGALTFRRAFRNGNFAQLRTLSPGSWYDVQPVEE